MRTSYNLSPEPKPPLFPVVSPCFRDVAAIPQLPFVPCSNARDATAHAKPRGKVEGVRVPRGSQSISACHRGPNEHQGVMNYEWPNHDKSKTCQIAYIQAWIAPGKPFVSRSQHARAQDLAAKSTAQPTEKPAPRLPFLAIFVCHLSAASLSQKIVNYSRYNEMYHLRFEQKMSWDVFYSTPEHANMPSSSLQHLKKPQNGCQCHHLQRFGVGICPWFAAGVGSQLKTPNPWGLDPGPTQTIVQRPSKKDLGVVVGS